MEAKSAEVWSLSTTASSPWKSSSSFSITGTPPQPAAITNSPLSNNDFIEDSSMNPMGSGDGTTLL